MHRINNPESSMNISKKNVFGKFPLSILRKSSASVPDAIDFLFVPQRSREARTSGKDASGKGNSHEMRSRLPSFPGERQPAKETVDLHLPRLGTEGSRLSWVKNLSAAQRRFSFNSRHPAPARVSIRAGSSQFPGSMRAWKKTGKCLLTMHLSFPSFPFETSPELRGLLIR